MMVVVGTKWISWGCIAVKRLADAVMQEWAVWASPSYGVVTGCEAVLPYPQCCCKQLPGVAGDLIPSGFGFDEITCVTSNLKRANI